MMKRIINCLSILFVVAIMLTSGACGRKTPSGYYVDNSDYLDSIQDGIDTNDENTDANTDANTESKKTDDGSAKNESGSATDTSGKSPSRIDENIWQIKRNISPQNSSSIMKNLNFGGKTFKMLVYQAIYTKTDEKVIKEFSEKYNCKINVEIIDYESYPSVLSTSLASGKPYDIIRVHCGFFPQIATSRLCQPLESAISKDDLTSSSKKTGINWDATMSNCTWNNHIYYVLDRRVGPLQILLYNKLLFKQCGLEDALDLYKKGQWTVAKMEEYAKNVSSSSSSVKFYNDTVSGALAAVKCNNAGFWNISLDGKVTWLGANSNLANYYKEEQRLRALSPLSALSAQVDTMTNGQCMVHFIEAEKLSVFENNFKTSQAFGKDLKNVGVVPIPLSSNGKYKITGPEGFAASRGCDPKAAVAMAIYYSMQPAVWEVSNIPALIENKDIFNSIYDKYDLGSAYSFRVADGRKADEVIFEMYEQIDKGGDIMKLLQDYAPAAKTALEYSLSKQ